MWSSTESREVGTNKQETLENALKRLSRFRITFFLQLFPVRLADKIQKFYIHMNQCKYAPLKSISHITNLSVFLLKRERHA